MKLSSQIISGFAIVIVLSLVDSYINYMLSQKVNRNTVFLANSEAVIRNSSKLHKSIIDMQSAFRGFLLTDDEDFLEPYYRGLKAIPALFIAQKKLVKSSELQEMRLDSISRLHHQWIGYANSLISAKKEALAEPSPIYNDLFENKLRKKVGRHLNNQITDIFQEFDRYEYAVRESRRVQLVTSIERTETFSFVFIILTVILGLISSVYIVKLISKRISLMVTLAENISKGKFAVVKDDKNDELTSLSHSLNIMSKKLSKNIQELEKKNTELNQFAYVVSHDLKAPMRGIYNVIQWIEEDLRTEISPQMRKYLNIIPNRIQRMENLIHGLLDYARIGREKPLKEQVDVKELLLEITELIVPSDFKIKIHKMPVLYTEKIRLEQVFSNLISNSVKYAGQDKGHIIISSRELAEFYEFKVQDNGIGIEPEFHHKIFIIFQTLREKYAKESTGIGLAIVKKIIDDQHCTIEVDSEAGKGAAFIFTWPKN